jgi:hypothetical protein
MYIYIRSHFGSSHFGSSVTFRLCAKTWLSGVCEGAVSHLVPAGAKSEERSSTFFAAAAFAAAVAGRAAVVSSKSEPFAGSGGAQ